MATFDWAALSAAPQVPRGTATVTIFAGAGEEKFVVHKDPLCAASKFFDGAFNGQFAEGRSNELRLPEEHPGLIELLCDWIYIPPKAIATWHPAEFQNTWLQDCFWLEVFMMADRLLIPGLSILALGRVITIFNHLIPRIPTIDLIRSLYKGNGPEIIKQYIAQHIVYWMPKSVKTDDWLVLLKANGGLMTMFGSAIADMSTDDNAFTVSPHPNKLVWAQKHGFDVEELGKEARKADHLKTTSQQLPGYAQVNQARKHASYGVVADSTTWSKETSATDTPSALKKRKQGPGRYW
ncbi:hypothetical protein H2200_005054 [Cladophialophora chaetospira]|uniref:BTB domain-containing protein n=1 Tax=Cladophialophora chaetospira TaxID=386627 RepID=A0AA39CJ83_9EURO|nr:hypothetical protein H2200_005054 [Cladophialophora chaetospira]